MRRGFLAVAVTILVVLAVAVPAGDLIIARGKIHPGVTAWSLDAGGLSPEELERALAEQARTRLRAPLVLTTVDSGVTRTLVPADAGITLDARATVQRAYEVGRKRSWWADLRDRAGLWRRDVQVEPVWKLDEADWDETVDDLAVAVESLPKDAGLLLTNDGPKALAAEDGAALDREALRQGVLGALRSRGTTATLPLRSIPAGVSTEKARAALTAARLAFSRPVTLGYREQRFTLSPDQLAAAAEVVPEGVAGGRPLTFDTQEGRAMLSKLLAPVEQPPEDAQLQLSDDGSSFTVVPSRPGTVIEWDAVFAALDRASAQTDHRYVPISTKRAEPRLTTRDASELSRRRVVSSFTTYFSPSNLARVHNIQQVASILDGTLIRPGETFSFNDAVGPRTKAAGFDEAPVISGGVLTPGVGGGICQVSTTLFNAAFFAGLPVVERKAHSFYIDHYPIGRDATVSYGSTDLRFRNDTDQLVLISAETTDRSVRVALSSPHWDRVVSYETTPFTQVTRPASSAQHPRRFRDPSLKAGETSGLEPGVDGRTVTVTRVVRTKTGKPLFEDAFTSVYEPKDYLVRVGG